MLEHITIPNLKYSVPSCVIIRENRKILIRTNTVLRNNVQIKLKESLPYLIYLRSIFKKPQTFTLKIEYFYVIEAAGFESDFGFYNKGLISEIGVLVFLRIRISFTLGFTNIVPCLICTFSMNLCFK